MSRLNKPATSVEFGLLLAGKSSDDSCCRVCSDAEDAGVATRERKDVATKGKLAKNRILRLTLFLLLFILPTSMLPKKER